MHITYHDVVLDGISTNALQYVISKTRHERERCWSSSAAGTAATSSHLTVVAAGMSLRSSYNVDLVSQHRCSLSPINMA